MYVIATAPDETEEIHIFAVYLEREITIFVFSVGSFSVVYKLYSQLKNGVSVSVFEAFILTNINDQCLNIKVYSCRT